jgi:integrase
MNENPIMIGKPPTATTVAKLIAAGKPGKHCVDRGLYLYVNSPTSAQWVHRYMLNGKSHYQGLGSAINAVTFKQAQERAQKARGLKAEGIDPIERKRTERIAATPRVVPLFEAYARQYVETHSEGWRNGHNKAQWLSSLTRRAFPSIGGLPVDAIDTDQVLSVLRPLWNAKPASSMKLRGRIESILDAAKTQGHRDGENPARWKGHLSNLLAAPNKIARTKHLASMPYANLPGFLVALRSREGVASRCLEFLILTAARTGEAIGARWDEIDLDAATWTIPKTRMKADKEHRVPLSGRALAILQELNGRRESAFVFPSYRAGMHLSDTSLLKILQSTPGGEAVTTHGFRSSFRDWAGEYGADRELAEMALAHSVGSAVEQAYKRSDLLARRAKLMESWAAFLG